MLATQTYELNPDIIWTVVDGEALLLDMSSGMHFSLNGVATEIWTSLSESQTVANIAVELSRAYGLDQKTAESDVRDLVEQLCAESLCSPKVE